MTYSGQQDKPDSFVREPLDPAHCAEVSRAVVQHREARPLFAPRRALYSSILQAGGPRGTCLRRWQNVPGTQRFKKLAQLRSVDERVALS